jgi:2-polyprenyl-6-methoxyphenol hydroxylase-like FAD-dependent oxidoreductase
MANIHTPLRPPADHEVVVVGARSAGAATALLLARQGHDVLIADRATFPSDTLSSHGIMRGGVVQLARWGLLDAIVESGAPEIRTVSYHFGDGRVLARPVEDRAGVDFLIAPRRHVLDDLVLSEAVAAGARFEGGLTVTGVSTDPSGRVDGVLVRDQQGRSRRITASFVVGADGVRSRIARAVGARVLDERPPHGSTHYAYVAGLDTEAMELHVGDRTYAGVFPTHGGEANVWACLPAGSAQARGEGSLDLAALLDHAAPSLAERVRRARVTSPVRSAKGLPNHVRQGSGPGWALVGDAGYHRDPITGHGITDAFRDAELLARELGRSLRGDVAEVEALAAYTGQRDESLAQIFDITVALGAFPPVHEFVELQKQLTLAIDSEAARLADLPPLPTLELVGSTSQRGTSDAR